LLNQQCKLALFNLAHPVLDVLTEAKKVWILVVGL